MTSLPAFTSNFDPNRHLHHFDGLDLTHAEKLDLIETVRQMMEGFVDAAFGTHSEQIARDTERKHRAITNCKGVKSNNDIRNSFNADTAGAGLAGKIDP
jgi:activator of HSP90 ATPase